MGSSFMTRRDFLRTSALTLSLSALPSFRDLPRVDAATGLGFLAGVNYPWIAYGHDFGENGWGHDGLITNGWTFQTSAGSQGFTDTRRSTEQAHNGVASLRITADLVGQDPSKSRGEVYVDLRTHRPPGVAVPLNLASVPVTCWVHLPLGSAGWLSAPNGVQLFFKSDGWWSWYSSWQNIQPAWEGNWVRLRVNLSAPPAFADPQFNPTKVIALGLKVAINQLSTATLQGPIYLDDYVLATKPSITFDFEQLEVERDFSTVAQAIGKCFTRVVRVFVFTDGRATPDFGPTGEVAGIDEYVFQDFDALLAAATKYSLLVIPALVDFSWCDSATFEGGVQLGGHSDIIRDPVKRQTFLDRALTPLIQRYCGHPQILAWEVINEPEWAMVGVPATPLVGDPVTIAEMQDFVRACAATIHTSCAFSQVTVGSARRKWLVYWQGQGLDLYQFHWYDHFAAEEPFPWPPYAELGLDKPCFIGEVPTASTQHSTTDYLQAACAGGYQGLLVWSYRGSDQFSNFSAASQPLKNWCANPACR